MDHFLSIFIASAVISFASAYIVCLLSKARTNDRLARLEAKVKLWPDLVDLYTEQLANDVEDLKAKLNSHLDTDHDQSSTKQNAKH